MSKSFGPLAQDRRRRRSRSARARSRKRSARATDERTERQNRCECREPRQRVLAEAVMSTPSMRIDPVDGASSPAMRPRSVDLPLPEAPVTAITRPSGIVRSSGCRIVSIPAPLGTVFETCLSSITRLRPSGREPIAAPARPCRQSASAFGVGMDAVGLVEQAWPATLSRRKGISSTRSLAATSRNAVRNDCTASDRSSAALPSRRG